MAFVSNIRRFYRNNVATLRSSPLAEISGALGDLGTLLPLMITLAVNGSISLSTTLVFSGLFNIITGVVFGIPLPVQPMKVYMPIYIYLPLHTCLKAHPTNPFRFRFPGHRRSSHRVAQQPRCDCRRGQRDVGCSASTQRDGTPTLGDTSDPHSGN
ncbi:hypothetical protein F4810DRAFT_246130 [Camillea tinctor]|nr:hypothetical protein F4810DRAFT_246130 [Camillea tinctor]